MAAEPVIEQVADHIEEVAEVTRQIDNRAVGFFLGGVGFGAIVGFVVGYRFNREKIKAEAFKQSEDEVAKIRELYQQKMVAAQEKPAAEAIVKEQGYAVVDDPVDDPIEDQSLRPLRPPVPIDHTKRVFRSEMAEKDKMDGWVFPKELSQRSPTRPYIIHQDEFARNDVDFAQVTYVYYAGDDVLVGEDEQILENRDELIGPGTLNRFGHGTDDFNILYVRNMKLELEIEICRSPGSYEVEVLGLEPDHEQSD